MGRVPRLDSVSLSHHSPLQRVPRNCQGEGNWFGSGRWGLVEFFSTFGLAATLVFEVAAIILLLRTFSGGRPVRALFSVISICCSGFMLTILGLFLWLFVFRSHP